MNCNCTIRAYHRMEERYAGLNLECDTNEDRLRALMIIEEVKSNLKMYPDVFDNQKDDGTGGVYIEFEDDYDKESGIFFEEVIQKLGIKECEF